MPLCLYIYGRWQLLRDFPLLLDWIRHQLSARIYQPPYILKYHMPVGTRKPQIQHLRLERSMDLTDFVTIV